MMGKKKTVKQLFLFNRYRIAVAVIISLVIYLTISHVIQFQNQRVSFREAYLNELQTHNEILVQYLEYYLEQTVDEEAGWNSLFAYIQNHEQEQEHVWTYVAYDDVVRYYKNNDLMRTQGTFSLQGFGEQLRQNGMYVSEDSFELRGQTITIGLVAREKSVLREWGYSDSKAFLLLQSVIVSFLFAIISITFVWRTMNQASKIKEYEVEQMQLNRRIEAMNQKQTQQLLEEEWNKNKKNSVQIGPYDKDLINVLIRKAVQRGNFPVAIIHVCFHMGKYYYTKQKMSELKEQLQNKELPSYELLEIGKGEFVYLLIKPGDENWNTLLHWIKKTAEEIALANKMTVTVKERLITEQSVQEEQGCSF